MTDTPISSNQTETNQAQPILVAIDFSDDSRAALLWACEFADCVDGRLILLHVVHDPASSPGFYHSETPGEMQPMQDVAKSMMTDFLEDMKRKYPHLKALSLADTRLISGLPPGRIVEAAGLLSARLIVIGSRGMTGLDHMLLGSVAERVVELAPGPVVVVKSESSRKKKKKEKKRKKDKKKLKQQIEQQVDANG
jgi:nucleotide-binding universal stress UspA family protein